MEHHHRLTEARVPGVSSHDNQTVESQTRDVAITSLRRLYTTPHVAVSDVNSAQWHTLFVVPSAFTTAAVLTYSHISQQVFTFFTLINFLLVYH